MAEYLEYDWSKNRLALEIHKEDIRNRNTPPDQTTSIQALRSFIQTGSDAQLKSNMQQDDATLLKFLYARKFNIPDAYLLLQNYYWYRRKNPDLFNDFSIRAPDIRKCIENVLPGILKSRDRKGRRVVILNANNWDCSYPLLTIYRALLYALEVLVGDVQNQANGLVVIVDWTEFTFRQATHLKPGVIRMMIEGLQDCFPARFKGIHFVGQPWYMETALTFIKPFLKEKTKERIYVHGNNLSTLHDYVPKDILPAEMGGEMASYNPQLWIDSVDQKIEETQQKHT